MSPSLYTSFGRNQCLLSLYAIWLIVPCCYEELLLLGKLYVEYKLKVLFFCVWKFGNLLISMISSSYLAFVHLSTTIIHHIFDFCTVHTKVISLWNLAISTSFPHLVFSLFFCPSTPFWNHLGLLLQIVTQFWYRMCKQHWRHQTPSNTASRRPVNWVPMVIAFNVCKHTMLPFYLTP